MSALRGALVVVALCAVGSVVHADRASDRADRADQLFKKGKRLLADKRYPEACTAFEESDKLDPGIGAKLNVARCYQEWGKVATAWRWYTDAERMAKQTKDDRAKKIQALITELDPSVPRLTVNAPRGAKLTGVEIKLDGSALELEALGSAQRVDPGPHQVDAIVDGARQSKTVPVERGGSAEVMIDLPRRKPDERTASVEAPGDPDRSWFTAKHKRWLGYGAAGVGVATVGVAGVITLRARTDYHYALDNHCLGATDMCDDVGLDHTHSARSRANRATVATVAGFAIVAGGLVYALVFADRSERASETAWHVAPSLSGGSAGVVLDGGF